MIQSRLYVYSYSSPRFYPAIPAVKKRKKERIKFLQKERFRSSRILVSGNQDLLYSLENLTLLTRIILEAEMEFFGKGWIRIILFIAFLHNRITTKLETKILTRPCQLKHWTIWSIPCIETVNGKRPPSVGSRLNYESRVKSVTRCLTIRFDRGITRGWIESGTNGKLIAWLDVLNPRYLLIRIQRSTRCKYYWKEI